MADLDTSPAANTKVHVPAPAPGDVAFCTKVLADACKEYAHALDGPAGRASDGSPATLETATQYVTALAKWAVRLPLPSLFYPADSPQAKYVDKKVERVKSPDPDATYAARAYALSTIDAAAHNLLPPMLEHFFAYSWFGICGNFFKADLNAASRAQVIDFFDDDDDAAPTDVSSVVGWQATPVQVKPEPEVADQVATRALVRSPPPTTTPTPIVPPPAAPPRASPPPEPEAPKGPSRPKPRPPARVTQPSSTTVAPAQPTTQSPTKLILPPVSFGTPDLESSAPSPSPSRGPPALANFKTNTHNQVGNVLIPRYEYFTHIILLQESDAIDVDREEDTVPSANTELPPEVGDTDPAPPPTVDKGKKKVVAVVDPADLIDDDEDFFEGTSRPPTSSPLLRYSLPPPSQPQEPGAIRI